MKAARANTDRLAAGDRADAARIAVDARALIPNYVCNARQPRLARVVPRVTQTDRHLAGGDRALAMVRAEFVIARRTLFARC